MAAGAVFVVGLLAAGAWVVAGLLSSWRAPDDFSRAVVPGSLTMQVREAGKQYLYVEHPHGATTPTLQQLGIQVTGPSGSVAVTPSTATVEYDAASGDVGTLVGTFQAPRPGTYTVTSTGPSAGLTLTAGESVAGSFLTAVLGAIVVAGACMVVAIGLLLIGLKAQRVHP